MQVSLITTTDAGEPVICSLALANGLGIAHRALIASIRKHIKSVEEFGRVLFRKAPLKTSGGVQLATLVDLNENQALFVGSLSENSPQVVSFKVAIVREFDKARKAIDCAQKAIHIPQQNLINQIAKLEKAVKLLRRDRVSYFHAKVQARSQRKEEHKVSTQRSELFALWERYVKICRYESADFILDSILQKLVKYYLLDLKIQKRKVGEHYFDVAIRFGMGHCVSEIIKGHMSLSGELK